MSWTIFQGRSLKTKITLATLAIFLLSLWALSTYVSYMQHKDMERLLGKQQFSTVSLVAAQLNRQLASRIEALELVARLSRESMQAGPAALQSMIEKHPELLAQINGGVYVTGKDGTAIAPISIGNITSKQWGKVY